jgi:hypothetical protein
VAAIFIIGREIGWKWGEGMAALVIRRRSG